MKILWFRNYKVGVVSLQQGTNSATIFDDFATVFDDFAAICDNFVAIFDDSAYTSILQPLYNSFAAIFDNFSAILRHQCVVKFNIRSETTPNILQ